MELPEYRNIRVELAGDVLELVLHRPERLNAMSGAMMAEIADLLERVAGGPWRTLLLRGDGRAFCAGADLGEFVDEVDIAEPERVSEHISRLWHGTVMRIRELPVPVVAAVHGAAYGGGANLALAADLVIAGESAVFCEPYILHGISPDCGATSMLTRLVGLQHARRMLLLGHRVDALEAARIGLVAEVIADDALLQRASSVARELAARDPHAMRATRDLINRNLDTDLASTMSREAEAVAQLLGGPSFREVSGRYRSSQSGT